jgi:hypothetical protein
MAEDHVAGSDLGPLFTKIIADQFNRLRAGDRFFYLNESWNRDELRLMKQGNSWARVIEANTGSRICKPTFSSSRHRSAAEWSRSGSGHGSDSSSPHGLSGVTVQLQDSTGNVLATTVTNSSGAITASTSSMALAARGLYR